MRITGVTVDQFDAIVRRVTPDYGHNLVTHRDAHNVSRRSMRGRLTVVSSRGPGARRSWSGRRLPAACWHAYRDVLTLLFEVYPTARVYTSMARYIGREGFHRVYRTTRWINVGSVMEPAYMPDLCDCPH